MIPRIAHQWETLAYYLDFTLLSDRYIIHEKKKTDPEACTIEMIKIYKSNHRKKATYRLINFLVVSYI